MAGLDLSAAMEQLASQLETVDGLDRVHAWPADHVNPPAGIVGYPESWEFDTTYQRGSDMAVFPVWLLVSNAYSRVARDQLAQLILPTKTALDDDDPETNAFTTVCAQQIDFDVLAIGGQDLLSALFRVSVYS